MSRVAKDIGLFRAQVFDTSNAITVSCVELNDQSHEPGTTWYKAVEYEIPCQSCLILSSIRLQLELDFEEVLVKRFRVFAF
jgi:hypothetical protein